MPLTERRKADRVQMAEVVRALAVAHGLVATVKNNPFGEIHPRMVLVTIEGPRGARVGIDFDGDSPQPDVFVVSWHTTIDATACYASTFARSRNEYHRQKATDVAYGFDALMTLLRWRFESLRSGAAFESEKAEA